MGTIASQITSLTIVYSTVNTDADQRKHRSSAALAFVWGIHRWPMNSPHKWPITRKMFPFDDVIIPTKFGTRYEYDLEMRPSLRACRKSLRSSWVRVKNMKLLMPVSRMRFNISRNLTSPMSSADIFQIRMSRPESSSKRFMSAAPANTGIIITGPLWGEFTGHLTRGSDTELWYFLFFLIVK